MNTKFNQLLIIKNFFTVFFIFTTITIKENKNFNFFAVNNTQFVILSLTRFIHIRKLNRYAVANSFLYQFT